MIPPLTATVTYHHPHGDERVVVQVSTVRIDREIDRVCGPDGAVIDLIPSPTVTYRLEGTLITQAVRTNGGVACDAERGSCACGAWH